MCGYSFKMKCYIRKHWQKKILDIFWFQDQDINISDIYIFLNSKSQEMTNESSSPIPSKKSFASQPFIILVFSIVLIIKKKIYAFIIFFTLNGKKENIYMLLSVNFSCEYSKLTICNNDIYLRLVVNFFFFI